MNKNIQAIYPLSPLQEGILYHTIENANSDVYFQQFSCVIEGLADPERWQQSWQHLSQKHAILRTLFTWENRPKPLQIVRERIVLPWTQLDWRKVSEQQVNQQWEDYKVRDRDLNFDFSIAPLMRFTLVDLGHQRYYFLFSFHHIVLDGWSQRLLIEEAISLYSQHNEHQRTNKSADYPDFIQWVEKEDKQAAEVFWTNKLAGFKQVTNIINDRDTYSAHDSQNSRGSVELRLNPDIYEKLKLEAKRHQLTLNSLFLGAWALILAAHNRTDNVVFGTTVSGRSINLSNIDRIVGLLINTLPFRAQIQNDLSLSQWLSTLQKSQAQMRQFEQSALSDIQRFSELRKRESLFESIVVVENLAGSQNTESSSKISINQPQYTEYSHYPLAILIDPSDGLKLIAVHQYSKISSERADEVLIQLQTVLTQMAESLDFVVSSIRTMPSPNKNLQITKWNQTQHTFDDVVPVHRMFERWAVLKADQIAVIDNTGTQEIYYSYAELNTKANKLAHFLLTQALTENSLVPILVARSALALISFLAVMKAGAAYIPLDSEQPTERLNGILASFPEEDCLVISQTSLQHKLQHSAERLILLDQNQMQVDACSGRNVDKKVSLEQLAYVIFTSGSTGLPKGVMIEHKALANSTLARQVYYPEAPETFLLMSPLATDSSLAGIYWTLCSGNTLLLPAKGIEQDMHGLGQHIKQYAVSHLLCIPSLYQLILENIDTPDLQSINTVIVAGESCKASVVSQHQTLLASAQLYNEYGPSECCVWATASNLSDLFLKQNVTIGSAIANTQAYVLNEDLEPVLPNIPGQLYLGGENLACGYLQQSDKTTEVFVDNPFDNSPGSTKLYKTGDLAKYDLHGNLYFLGRVDNQIKVRGFRIEPEEIEQILAMHPQVSEALVFLEGNDVDDASIIEALFEMDEFSASALLDEIEQAFTTEVNP